ncbi:hypothetical protein HanRHA438_Chr14g0668691 [Helianthus annuus]|nr:hypothetical protein HanRHA438_Chr14g0668691 [Helianthus annuus]
MLDIFSGRSTLRPADVLVFGWAGGKHACLDFTRVSPLLGSGKTVSWLARLCRKQNREKLLNMKKLVLRINMSSFPLP